MPAKRKAATKGKAAPKRSRRSKKEEDISESEEDDVELDSEEEEVGDEDEEVTQSAPRSSASSNRPKRAASFAKAEAKASIEKGDFGLSWHEANDTLMVLDSQDIKPSNKFVGFDMDSTLVEPKSGAKFPKNRNDWTWLMDEVPKKLKELNSQGFKVIIFTNQAGIEKGHQNAGDIKGKILDLCKEVGFPMQAFVATATDINRKPNITMFSLAQEKYNGGVKYDLKTSLYVGDAAGRAKGWKADRKADFSCGDRGFAFNIGVPFKTPEEFFLGESPAPFEWDGIDPKKYLESIPKDLKDPDAKDVIGTGQELVIMVGRPASGKSTFTKRFFVPAGYVHVNQDTLKTKDKCVKAAKEAVANGKSVVVDNTNPSESVRGEFLAIAKAAGIPARCFSFTLDVDLSHHLNFYREKLTNGAVRRIPDIGYNMFKKNFKEPAVEEGFAEVRKIPFVPHFENDQEREMFLQRTG